MEIVHPQPFSPLSMLHLQLIGHPNLPPHTYGVLLFDPASERLVPRNDGIAYNITTVDIEFVMRRAAATIYNLDPVEHKNNYLCGQATLSTWGHVQPSILKDFPRWRLNISCAGSLMHLCNTYAIWRSHPAVTI